MKSDEFLSLLSGFITDGNSKLVGNARLRQVRVHKNSCRTSSFMSRSIQDCHAPYSWEVEDMGSYGPGWNRSNDVNLSKSLLMPWRYQTQSRLRTHPIWGRVAFYRGGGFVVDLGPNKENASRYVIPMCRNEEKLGVSCKVYISDFSYSCYNSCMQKRVDSAFLQIR